LLMRTSEKDLRKKIEFLQSLRLQEKNLLDEKYANTIEKFQKKIYEEIGRSKELHQKVKIDVRTLKAGRQPNLVKHLEKQLTSLQADMIAIKKSASQAILKGVAKIEKKVKNSDEMKKQMENTIASEKNCSEKQHQKEIENLRSSLNDMKSAFEMKVQAMDETNARLKKQNEILKETIESVHCYLGRLSGTREKRSQERDSIELDGYKFKLAQLQSKHDELLEIHEQTGEKMMLKLKLERQSFADENAISKKKIEQLQESVATKEAQLKNLKCAKIKDLEEKCAVFEKELETERAKVIERMGMVAEIRQELSERESRHQEAIKRIEGKMDRALKNRNQEIEKLKKELRGLNHELLQRKMRTNDIEDVHFGEIAHLKISIEDLKRSNEVMKDKVRTVEIDREGIITQRESLRKECESYKEQVEECKLKLQKKSQDIAEKEIELGGKEKILEEKENSLGEARLAVKDLRSQIKEMNKQNTANVNKDKIAFEKRVNQTKNEYLEELKGLTLEISNLKTELNKQRCTLNVKIECLKKSQKVKEGESDALRERVKGLKVQVADLKKRMESNRKSLTRKNEKLICRVELLKESNKSLKAKNDVLSTAIVDVREEYNEILKMNEKNHDNYAYLEKIRSHQESTNKIISQNLEKQIISLEEKEDIIERSESLIEKQRAEIESLVSEIEDLELKLVDKKVQEKAKVEETPKEPKRIRKKKTKKIKKSTRKKKFNPQNLGMKSGFGRKKIVY